MVLKILLQLEYLISGKLLLHGIQLQENHCTMPLVSLLGNKIMVLRYMEMSYISNLFLDASVARINVFLLSHVKDQIIDKSE